MLPYARINDLLQCHGRDLMYGENLTTGGLGNTKGAEVAEEHGEMRSQLQLICVRAS